MEQEYWLVKGFLSFFDAIAISEEEGCRKPEATIFDLLFDRLGHLPAQRGTIPVPGRIITHLHRR